LAGNLDAVREDSEGISRQLQTLLRLCIMLLRMRWWGSLYWGPRLWGTFVSLFAFSRKCPYGAICDCMVFRWLIMSMVWHWTVYCALRNIYVISLLREWLTESERNGFGPGPHSSSLASFWTSS